MGTTARPSDAVQRADCIASLAFLAQPEPQTSGSDGKVKDKPKIPSLVRSTVIEMFFPARDRYLAALGAYRVAQSTEEAARLASAAADKVFDRAFRHWSKSVKNEEGLALPKAIAKLLGGVRPGKLVKLPYRKEVNLTAYLFEQLAPLPHLQGEPARLAALVAAHAVLAEKVNAFEAAERTRKTSKRKLDAAIKDFDSKWRATVDMFLNNCPEVAQDILPAFPVRSHKAKSASGEPTAPEGKDKEELEDESLVDEELEDEEEDVEDEDEQETCLVTPTDATPPLT